MNTDILNEINTTMQQVTKMSTEYCKKLVNWFNKQNILIQTDVFKEQKNQFFKIKSDVSAGDIKALTAFYLAIDKYYKVEQLEYKKNKGTKLEGLNSVSDLALKKYKTVEVKPKREKLLNLWSVVKGLKNGKYSYREISHILKKRHRFNVSHTYIHNVYKELEND